MGIERDSKIDLWLTEDSLFLISCWVRDGITKLDIAKKIGISPNTIIKWEKQYPQFAEAMRKNREIVDYEVENALYKCAIGFKTTEVKTIIAEQDKNGNRPVRIEKTEKEFAPNVTAALAWLNNRKPDKWKRNRDNFMDANSEDNNIVVKIKKAENGDVTIAKKRLNEEDDWDSDDWEENDDE